MNHTYRGKTELGGGITVTVDDRHCLDPFLGVERASNEMPEAFSWSAGPGRVRLAFALLFHASSENHELAKKWCEKFCTEEVSQFSQNWTMSSRRINAWIREKEEKETVKRQFEKMKRSNSKSRFHR